MPPAAVVCLLVAQLAQPARRRGGAWPRARPRARRSRRGGGARARAGGRCGAATRSSISRRRVGPVVAVCHSSRSAARASSASSSSLSSSRQTPEQLLEAQRVAQALDVALAVGAVRAGLAAARRPGAARSPRSSGSSAASSRRAWRPRRCAARRGRRSAVALTTCCGPQQRDAGADERGRGQHPQRGVHVVDERARAARRRGPRRAPEKILNSTSFGTAAVTIASTKAIEITAPVFCSIVRAPAAIPRRFGGHGAHHRRGVGRVEHARADADERAATARSASRACRPAASSCRPAPTARDEHARAPRACASRGGRPRCRPAARRSSIPSAIGASLMPGGDRVVALGALEVEDEDEQQREAREAVDEGGARSRRRTGGSRRSSGRASARGRGARSARTAAAGRRRRRGRRSTSGSFQPERPPLEMPSTRPVRPATNVARAEQVEAAHACRAWPARAGRARPRAPPASAERHVEPEDPVPGDRRRARRRAPGR